MNHASVCKDDTSAEKKTKLLFGMGIFLILKKTTSFSI